MWFDRECSKLFEVKEGQKIVNKDIIIESYFEKKTQNFMDVYNSLANNS